MYEWVDPAGLLQVSTQATHTGYVNQPGGLPMINPRVAPQLVYDTRDHPLAAGVRSVGGPARRLLFTADATELVLQMTPERRPGRIRLMGQVLDNGMPIGGVSVQL